MYNMSQVNRLELGHLIGCVHKNCQTYKQSFLLLIWLHMKSVPDDGKYLAFVSLQVEFRSVSSSPKKHVEVNKLNFLKAFN